MRESPKMIDATVRIFKFLNNAPKLINAVEISLDMVCDLTPQVINELSVSRFFMRNQSICMLQMVCSIPRITLIVRQDHTSRMYISAFLNGLNVVYS